MMLSTYQIIQLVLAAVIAGLYIYKKVTGKDLLRHVMLSRPVVAALGSTVQAIYKIWPDKSELKIVNTVMNAAIEATEIAEKAWKMGNLKKDERNPYAKKQVKETLNKAGIAVTPQIEMIINGVIEAVCIVLPHEEHIVPDPVVVGNVGDE